MNPLPKCVEVCFVRQSGKPSPYRGYTTVRALFLALKMQLSDKLCSFTMHLLNELKGNLHRELRILYSIF